MKAGKKFDDHVAYYGFRSYLRLKFFQASSLVATCNLSHRKSFSSALKKNCKLFQYYGVVFDLRTKIIKN